MKKQRPVNLNLLTIRFPLAAIVSILHRISGVILFLAIPLLLLTLSYAVSSQASFQELSDFLSGVYGKILLTLFLAPFLYHFVAGIRHLLMDMDVGVQLKSGRVIAVITLLVALLLFVLAGIYVW